MYSIASAVSTVLQESAKTTRGRQVKLNAPATIEQLRLLSIILGRQIPGMLQEWLFLHNGECGLAGFLAEGLHLFGTEEIVRRYVNMVEAETVDRVDQSIRVVGNARQVWGSRSWVPFAEFDYFDLYVELDPPAGGVGGQIIGVDVEGGSVRVLYASLLDMFVSFAEKNS